MSKVLVLDKDDNTRCLIQNLLEPEGFSISAAHSAIDLERGKEASGIDLYIIDIAAAGSNGLELVRRLRTHSSCGIIILSTQDCEASHVEGLELGADDFVVKPFRPRELAARVKAVYRRTAIHGPQVRSTGVGIRVGGYRLIPDSRKVLDSDGREIALTTAEYNIFSVLAAHQGEVLSRDEIIGLSKGRDWRCYERSVDGLISRLRRKLPVAGDGSHFIKTVHGSGYTIARV